MRFLIRTYVYSIRFILLFFIIGLFMYQAVCFIFPWIYKYVYEEIIFKGNQDYLFTIAILVGFLSIFAVAFNFLNQYFSMKMTCRLRKLLRFDFITKLINYKYDYYTEHARGDIINGVVPEVDITAAVIQYLCKLIIYFIQIVFFFAVFIFFNPFIGIVATGVYSIAIGITYLLKRSVNNIGKKQAKLREAMYSFYNCSIYGIKEIKCNNLYDFQKSELLNLSKKNIKLATKTAIINGSLKALSNILPIIVSIVIITYSFYQLRIQALSFGEMISLMVLAGVVISPVFEFISSIIEIHNGWPTVLKMRKRWMYPCEMLAGPAPDSMATVDFSRVSFSYGNNIPILNRFNLSITENNFISLVGETGSGKTTTINLLLKLFSPESGSIIIGTQNIDLLGTKEIRDSIGIVSQAGFVFNETIKNNIDVRNALSDQEVLEICQSVELSQFIERLPDGIHSEISELGKNISGGERQRILIARCLAKKVKMIVLDEATSSLDYATEEKIIKLLLKLKKKKQLHMIIAVTHRPSFAKYSDTIFVLDNGRIAEVGSHKELLQHDGIYTALFQQ